MVSGCRRYRVVSAVLSAPDGTGPRRQPGKVCAHSTRAASKLRRVNGLLDVSFENSRYLVFRVKN